MCFLRRTSSTLLLHNHTREAIFDRPVQDVTWNRSSHFRTSKSTRIPGDSHRPHCWLKALALSRLWSQFLAPLLRTCPSESTVRRDDAARILNWSVQDVERSLIGLTKARPPTGNSIVEARAVCLTQRT